MKIENGILKKAGLIDVKSEAILEIGCFNKGVNYSEICLMDIEEDRITGSLFINGNDYQAEVTSIADNVRYEQGILLQRQNDFNFLHGFLGFTKQLTDFIENDINEDDVLKEFFGTFSSSYHEQNIDYEMTLIRKQNDRFGIAFKLQLTKGYKDTVRDRIIQKYPQLGFDGSERIVSMVEKKEILEFIVVIHELIGKATVQTYFR